MNTTDIVEGLEPEIEEEEISGDGVVDLTPEQQTGVEPIAEEAPIEEEETPVAEEALEINIDLSDPTAIKSFRIVLAGAPSTQLDYGINGAMGKLQCGVPIVVSEPVYHAVKAHIIEERD